MASIWVSDICYRQLTSAWPDPQCPGDSACVLLSIASPVSVDVHACFPITIIRLSYTVLHCVESSYSFSCRS
jgi:hypothetical protein